VKYSTLAAVFGMFLLTGCGIEKKINNATDKCETIVSEALEGLEDTCLTKEEILDLLSSFQSTHSTDGMTNFCEDIGPHEN
tara:strand:- start:161 stop:403 length:243 start_codon:yes stop_codon:yes gene_type:complete